MWSRSCRVLASYILNYAGYWAFLTLDRWWLASSVARCQCHRVFVSKHTFRSSCMIKKMRMNFDLGRYTSPQALCPIPTFTIPSTSCSTDSGPISLLTYFSIERRLAGLIIGYIYTLVDSWYDPKASRCLSSCNLLVQSFILWPQRLEMGTNVCLKYESSFFQYSMAIPRLFFRPWPCLVCPSWFIVPLLTMCVRGVHLLNRSQLPRESVEWNACILGLCSCCCPYWPNCILERIISADESFLPSVSLLYWPWFICT